MPIVQPFVLILHRALVRGATALRRDEGTASMEFVLVVPLLLMVFMAAFESGLMMVRSIMLEQSVDMTMRELRLGHYKQVTNQLLKKEICSRTIVFPDCEASMKVDMQRISTAAWDMPATRTPCINRQEAAEPVVSLDPGSSNDLMLVRVCVATKLMFPTTGLGLQLPVDQNGDFQLVTRTAFSVEPK